MNRKIAGSQTGLLLQKRRQDMELSLARLSSLLGGTPGASFISKVEANLVVPTVQIATRLAEGLNLPVDVVLNATGHATLDQVRVAEDKLRGLLLSTPPMSTTLEVFDRHNPDGSPLGRRNVIVKAGEQGYVVNMDGAENEPFIGDLVVSTSREPAEGQGVIALIDGSLSAWTYHILIRQGSYIENGRGEKRTRNYVLRGVILRVTTTRDLVA